MTKDEEILAKVMQEKGYAVIGSDKLYPVGYRLKNSALKILSEVYEGQPLAIVAHTDRADFEESIRVAGGPIPGYQAKYFYRVSTD